MMHQFRLRRIALAALAGSLVLGGCVPVVYPYLRVEAPGATYFDSTCGYVPPPDVAYLPYHGIFLSIQLDTVLVGLHVPDGTVVRLQTDRMVIDGITSSGRQVSKVVRLQISPHDAIGWNMPRDFRTLDPFQKGMTTTLGPLRGRGSAFRLYTWYLFVGKDPEHPEMFFTSAPKGMRKGTITLPGITVNGTYYGPATLRVDTKHYTGIMPVNC